MNVAFQWPWALALLALLPLLGWLYRRGLGSRAEAVVFYPDLLLLSQAGKQSRGYWRHLPALLYGLALLLGIVALARPTLPVPEADPRAGIILALDISRSMQATDILPSRFEAARSAIHQFIRDIPQGARVGLVTFSRSATLVVPLTTNKARLREAVDALQLDLGTAIGEGILESMAALPPLDERKDVQDPKSLATIILLTDGRNMGGADPFEAAALANDQQIRIHTIGAGSATEGPVPGLPEAYQFAAHFDEETLKAIAAATGGQYVFVNSASKIREAYKNLGKQLVWKVRQDEVSAEFALGAGLLLMASLLFSEGRRRVL